MSEEPADEKEEEVIVIPQKPIADVKPKPKQPKPFVEKPIGPPARSIHYEKSKAYSQVQLPPDLWNKENEDEKAMLKRHKDEYADFSESYYVKDDKKKSE